MPTEYVQCCNHPTPHYNTIGILKMYILKHSFIVKCSREMKITVLIFFKCAFYCKATVLSILPVPNLSDPFIFPQHIQDRWFPSISMLKYVMVICKDSLCSKACLFSTNFHYFYLKFFCVYLAFSSREVNLLKKTSIF